MSVTLNLPISLEHLEYLKREALNQHHAVSYYLGDAFFIQEECKRLGWDVIADSCGWKIQVTPESQAIFTTVFSYKFEEEILRQASYS